MCPRMSSSWPEASQQKSALQHVVHPPPPGPVRGLLREAAAEEPGRCRWKWLSTAPIVPGIKERAVPYLRLQRDKNDTKTC